MAGQSVGQIQLNLLLNSAAFRSQLQTAVNGAVTQTSSRISSRVTSTFSKLGKIAIAAFSIKVLTEFGKSCIKLGSDLQEVQNVVDVTFPQMNKQVNDWARNAMMNFGLSEKAAKQYMGTLGAMAKSVGFTEQEAYEMSTTLTGLVGDVASFYNLSADEAMTKIKAVFSGETEGLRTAFGVNMTQAELDEFALAKGYNKTTKAMTQQEKVALRYAFVQDRLKAAAGDFIRTQGSWANQTRILSLQWDSLKANLGKAFISVLTPVLQGLNLLIAKLVTASAAFKDFVESIFGAQEAVASGSTSELTEDAENAEESLTGATGAAQKLKKTLMGFDNLNVLPDNSSAGAGSGLLGDQEDSSKTKDDEPKDPTKLENTLNTLKSIADYASKIAKTNFLEGFGGQSADKILENLQNIKTKISEIFSAKRIVAAGQSFVESIIAYFGTAAGAISSIGVTIATFFTGSISKTLTDKRTEISRDIYSLFHIGEDIAEISSKWSKTIADIFSVFGGEDAIGIGSSLLSIVYDINMAIEQLGARVGRDFLDLITSPIVNNSEEIKTALNGLLGNFNTIFTSISNVVNNSMSKLVRTYDEDIKPFIDSGKEGLSDILGNFMTLWNTQMQPVLDEIGGIISNIFEEHISPVIGKVIEIVGKVANLLKGLWVLLQPIVNFIIEHAFPKMVEALQMAWRVASVVFKGIADFIGGLLTTLGGLIDFLTGIFTGDWEKAWNGVKDIFAGIWNALVAIIRVPMNLIIEMLNRMIRGINKLDFTMPDWVPIVGGKSLGFSIPELPLLAEGGYVGPDTPQLAVIGDNRHQGEIVAPENKLNEAVAANVRPVLSAIQQLMNVLIAQGQNGGGDITIPIYLDGSVLDEYVVTAQDRRTLRSGGLA